MVRCFSYLAAPLLLLLLLQDIVVVQTAPWATSVIVLRSARLIDTTEATSGQIYEYSMELGDVKPSWPYQQLSPEDAFEMALAELLQLNLLKLLVLMDLGILICLLLLAWE